MRIPDLARLIQGPESALPGHLLVIALREVLDQDDTAQSLVDQVKAGKTEEATRTIGALNDLERWLVAESVVEPQITVADIDAGLVPTEDLAMIAQIARRERFMDAEGVIIGVAPLDDFAVFREAHGCSERDGEEGCEACRTVRQRFSSVDMGAL